MTEAFFAYTPIVVLCLAGMIFSARKCVRYSARRWPNVEWNISDTAMVILCAVFWPIFIFCNNDPKPKPDRPMGFFARWHKEFQDEYLREKNGEQ